MTDTAQSQEKKGSASATSRSGVLIVDLSRSWGGAQASLCDWLAAAPSEFRSASRAVVACAALRERLGAMGCETTSVRVGHWRRSLLGLGTFLRDFVSLRKIVADSATSAASIYLNGVRSGLPLVGLSRKRTPRVVLHFRDVRGSRLADRLVARRADVVIATTKFQAGMLTPRIGAAADRMVIEANGVASPVLGDREAVRKRLEIPAGAKVVLLAADYIGWKRHERLLGALALLPGWHGVICGAPRDGRGQRLRRDLENLSRTLRVEPRVHFTGTLAIGDALAASDVLVSLADDEPFGRTVVEAMQVGLPVVAMHRGGPAELVEGYDGAILAEEEIPHISAAIRAAEAVQPSARDHWTPGRCAKKIIAELTG